MIQPRAGSVSRHNYTDKQTDMNQIKTLRFSGIKGKTKAIELTARTFITGRNRGGKTTVRDAILLALTGTHPDLPNTNKGVMKLASGPTMMAAATFLDGTAIERTWSLTKSGSIKGDVDGTAPAFDPFQFQPATFLAMGGKARLAYLASMASAAIIREILERRFGDDAKVMDIYDHTAGGDPFAAMEAIGKFIADRRRAVKQERDRTTKALQEHLTAKPVVMEEAAALTENGGLQRAMNEVANAAARVTAARDKLTTLITATTQRIEWQNKHHIGGADPLTVEEIEEMAELERRARDAAEHADERASIKAQIAALEGKIITGEEVDELLAFIKRYDDLGEVEVTTAPQEARIREINEEIVGIRAELQSLERELRKVPRDAIEPTCPHCGSTIDVEEANMQRNRLISELKIQIEDSSRDLEEAQKRLAEAEAERDEIKVRNQIRLEVGRARDQIAHNEAARDQIAALTGKAATIPLFSPTARERLETLTRYRDKLRAEELAMANAPRMIHPEEVERAREELDAAKIAHDEAQARANYIQEAANRVAALETWTTRSEEIEASRTEAETQLEKIVATEETFESAKSEMLQAVWEPIIGIANRLLNATFGAGGSIEAAYDETDIGIRDAAGGFRTFETLSGSETTVLAFALGAAIATRQPLRLTILDELGRLDAITRPRFIQAIGDLTEGGSPMLDQVVIFDHDDDTIARAIREAGFSQVKFD